MNTRKLLVAIICGSRYIQSSYPLEFDKRVSVETILKTANAVPRTGEHIWIRRDNSNEYRPHYYDVRSRLSYEHHNNCVIAISDVCPPPIQGSRFAFSTTNPQTVPAVPLRSPTTISRARDSPSLQKRKRKQKSRYARSIQQRRDLLRKIRLAKLKNAPKKEPVPM